MKKCLFLPLCLCFFGLDTTSLSARTSLMAPTVHAAQSPNQKELKVLENEEASTTCYNKLIPVKKYGWVKKLLSISTQVVGSLTLVFMLFFAIFLYGNLSMIRQLLMRKNFYEVAQE